MKKEMQYFGVTGKPIQHSLSPYIFNTAFKKMKYPGRYTRLAVNSAAEAFRLFNELHLKGMNITAPFKIEMMKYADEIDEHAANIGAINTLVRQGDKLKAYNTDHLGVANSILDFNIGIKGKRCVVLGAGGAGRAAAYALVRNGGKVTIINRTYQKARKAAFDFNCKSATMEDLGYYLNSAEIFVNTVNPHHYDLNYDRIKNEKLVILDSYTGMELLNLKAFLSWGSYIPGTRWLLNQALEGYKLFTGMKLETAMLGKWFGVRKNMGNNYFLSGFMGSGKTMIGEELTKRLRIRLIEIDNVINKMTGKRIPEIFEKEGEKYFRMIEYRALVETLAFLRNREQEALSSGIHKSIISCGGGIAENFYSRTLLKKQPGIIWIYSPPDVCYERIRNSDRPLLQEFPNPEAMNELFWKRFDRYFEISDLVVLNDGEPDSVIDTIMSEISDNPYFHWKMHKN